MLVASAVLVSMKSGNPFVSSETQGWRSSRWCDYNPLTGSVLCHSRNVCGKVQHRETPLNVVLTPCSFQVPSDFLHQECVVEWPPRCPPCRHFRWLQWFLTGLVTHFGTCAESAKRFTGRLRTCHPRWEGQSLMIVRTVRSPWAASGFLKFGIDIRALFLLHAAIVLG